jgi:NAD(P)H-hydrate epimerase
MINRSGLPVLAVDVPSGLDLDRGRVDGACIRARITGTMAFPKRGHLFYPGRSYVGSLRVIDIGVPAEVVDEFDLPVEVLSREDARSLIPLRDPAGHKGSFGHLFVVAGSVGLTGAAALSSVAALRAGCGLVTLGLPAGLNDLMEVKLTEVMTLPLPETPERSLAPEALDPILSFSKSCRAMVLGPGLSRQPGTGELVRKLLPEIDIPLLVDADGLNATADEPACLEPNAPKTVITPHYGELERLTDIPIAKSRQDPIGSALNASRTLNVVVALKGAPTVVATPDGHASVNPTGNSGLATAGSGDVLSGIIAGFLAQGLTPFDAARLGVYVHGLAADIMAGEIGEHGLVAGDLLQMIPGVIKNLLATETEELTNIVRLF